MTATAPLVLGIDPGTAIMGYGLVAERDGGLVSLGYGVITTPASEPLHRRLMTIYVELTALLARYQPAAAAVEELFFAKNARTALSVGHARGVILLAIAQAGVPLAQYKPSQVKQAVTGYGSATKPQVQDMVRLLLGLDAIPQPDDAADALAVAICHTHSARLQSLAFDSPS